MKKALDAILVMVALAAFGTVLTFLAKESTTGALILTWAPVAIGGSYAIGKAKGGEVENADKSRPIKSQH